MGRCQVIYTRILLIFLILPLPRGLFGNGESAEAARSLSGGRRLLLVDAAEVAAGDDRVRSPPENLLPTKCSRLYVLYVSVI